MTKAIHPAKTFRPFAEAHRAFMTSTRRPEPSTAIVFPDTNVLLAPYRSSTETLEAIRKTYATLCATKRFVVPAQVAREFARNRLDLLAELHKYVRDARSVSLNGRFEPPPILFATDECKEAEAQLVAVTDALKTYRSALQGLADAIAGWQTRDPVLDMYGVLFDKAVVRDHSVDADTLEGIRKARYEARVPPGYRDKSKDDGGVGDLAIWLTILETAATSKQDAIFVTEEAKTDWFHRSGDQRLFPRYELLEEFASATGGRCFAIMTLAELLKAYGASEKVVEEVRESASYREVPFWRSHEATQEHGDMVSLERLIAAEMRESMRAAGVQIEGGGKEGQPLLLRADDGRLGMTVVMVGDADNIYTIAGRRITRAREQAESHRLSEHLVVFVSPYERVARALVNWFTEDNAQGPELSAAVALFGHAGLRVLKNQARHPILRAIFDIPPASEQ